MTNDLDLRAEREPIHELSKRDQEDEYNALRFAERELSRWINIMTDAHAIDRARDWHDEGRCLICAAIAEVDARFLAIRDARLESPFADYLRGRGHALPRGGAGFMVAS